jgi:hypothetical protein
MGICRVVQPGITRLSLSGGDYIDVQQELNAGDYYDLLIAMTDRKPFAKILAYLLGWSLVGLDGQPLPYSLALPEQERRDTIRNLNKSTLRELVAVIDRHEEAEEAALVAKKKTPGDVPVSTATPTSPPSSAGATSGLIN